MWPISDIKKTHKTTNEPTKKNPEQNKQQTWKCIYWTAVTGENLNTRTFFAEQEKLSCCWTGQCQQQLYQCWRVQNLRWNPRQERKHPGAGREPQGMTRPSSCPFSKALGGGLRLEQTSLASMLCFIPCPDVLSVLWLPCAIKFLVLGP